MIAAGSFHLHRSYLRGSRRQLEQRVHLSGCGISRDHFCFNSIVAVERQEEGNLLNRLYLHLRRSSLYGDSFLIIITILLTNHLIYMYIYILAQ